MSDQRSHGQRFRVVNVVDDYTRECVFLGRRLFNLKDSGWPLSSIGLHKVKTLAKTLVCDNGPELTGKAMFSWSRRTSVKLHFIQQGQAHSERVH